MSKFLIAGLGNIGDEYAFTRHNIGFNVVEALAQHLSKEEKNPLRLFDNSRLAAVHECRFKGKTLVLIKPATFMNLSGRALSYWMQAAKIPLENVLVVTDDLALPYGTLRLRKKGSDGGHNGLSNIIEVLNTQEFSRIRFGIGNSFSKGGQVDYVLGKWSEEEQKILPALIEKSVEMIKSFVSVGVDRTMTAYN